MVCLRWIAGLAAVLAWGTAQADTAYLEPSTFQPAPGQAITIEASFNDYCCVPRHPLRSAKFGVIDPSGNHRPLDRIEMFPTMTILSHIVAGEGTTRFTTGERLGRKGEYVLLDGSYFLINSDDAPPVEIPPGAPILSSQTATVTDAYVTIGEPSWAAVDVAIGRLRFVPSQHPSSLSVGQDFELLVTFDGRPVPDQTVILTRSGQKDRPGDDGLMVTTDSVGRVAVPLSFQGTHLLMTRMQAPAPAGAETDIRSYTTSLTFDVKGAE